MVVSVARRFGMERSLFVALFLICVGIVIRFFFSFYLLFGGIAVIGGGIVLGNVLLLGLIKRDFFYFVVRFIGVYFLIMGVVAVLGSVMVVSLVLNGFGW